VSGDGLPDVVNTGGAVPFKRGITPSTGILTFPDSSPSPLGGANGDTHHSAHLSFGNRSGS
jgi:hypothetical protein